MKESITFKSLTDFDELLKIGERKKRPRKKIYPLKLNALFLNGTND